MSKFFAFVFVFFLFVGVGSVCVGQLVSDTSIISMSGADWSLKVDSALASSVDSRNMPYMTAKSTSEKELFLQLATLEDCKSGLVQFKIDMTGLTAYKQLPLNVELNAKEYSFVNATHAINGTDVLVYRPENIVNSFALFDDSGRKQVHISASKLVASDGATIWCDSNLQDGLLSIVLPLDWLESVKFPVVLDPTFGFTSIGASETVIGSSCIGCKFTLVDNANVTSIVFYTKCTTTTGEVYLGIYNDSASSPNSRLVVSSASVSDSYTWVYANITQYLGSGDYWLAFSDKGDTALEYNLKYDSGSVGQYKLDWDVSYLSDPFGGIDQTYSFKVSIYTDYAIYVEPTPTPTPSPSPSPTTTHVPITEGELSSAMLFVLGFMAIFCLVSLVWMRGVPIVGLIVGLFTVLVGLYCGLGGVYSLGVVQGWFSLFVALFGGLTMLLVGLGVRVRR